LRLSGETRIETDGIFYVSDGIFSTILQTAGAAVLSGSPEPEGNVQGF
jgi:hypothetical protein